MRKPREPGHNHTPLDIDARTHLAIAICEGAQLEKKELAVTGKGTSRAVAEL